MKSQILLATGAIPQVIFQRCAVDVDQALDGYHVDRTDEEMLVVTNCDRESHHGRSIANTFHSNHASILDGKSTQRILWWFIYSSTTEAITLLFKSVHQKHLT